MRDAKPTVLITGAGSGIGAATAKLFSERGHTVVLNGRKREKLEAVAASLPGKSHIMAADVRKTPEASWVISEAIKEAGPIGILVNNAGIYEPRNFLATDDETWLRTIETNLLGPVRLCRAL